MTVGGCLRGCNDCHMARVKSVNVNQCFILQAEEFGPVCGVARIVIMQCRSSGMFRSINLKCDVLSLCAANHLARQRV
jgi:hypothetical protein